MNGLAAGAMGDPNAGDGERPNAGDGERKESTAAAAAASDPVDSVVLIWRISASNRRA